MHAIPGRKGTKQTTPATSVIPDLATDEQSDEVSATLHLQHTIGNQAVQRLLNSETAEPTPSILGAQAKKASHKGIEDEEEPLKNVSEKCECEEEHDHVQKKADISRSTDLGAFDPRLTRSIHRAEASPGKARLLDRRAAAALQRQPAPPVAPAAPPAGRATVNFLPTRMDLTPTGWGVTTEDDVVVDITAYSSGATWKCVITTADQQAHQGVRLLPGVVEVTPALVSGSSSCSTLKKMITSLDSVANQGPHSGYYMLSAVQAHENLHITQYRADLAPHYATFRTAVEALTVPLAGSPNAAAAKAAIKALPAYTRALATFKAGDVAANNRTAAHTLAASFRTVEHGVVDPMITTIRARRTALKCP
jgi:hypothetical protein